MKYFYIFLSLLVSYAVVGQDVLLKSSKLTNEEPSSSGLNRSVKLDTTMLKPEPLLTKNQSFIKNIQQSTNHSDGELLDKNESAAISNISNSVLNNSEKENRDNIIQKSEKRISELRYAQQRADDNYKRLLKEKKESLSRIAKLEKEKAAMEEINVQSKKRADILASIAKEQRSYYNILNNSKTGLTKIVTELELTKDSLLELKKQVDYSRQQIKSSTFKFSALYSLFDTAFTQTNRLQIIEILPNLSASMELLDEEALRLNSAIISAMSDIDITLKSTVENEQLLDSLNGALSINVSERDSLSDKDLDKLKFNSQSIAQILKTLTISSNKNSLDRIRNEYKNIGKIYFSTIKQNYDTIDKQYVKFYNEKIRSRLNLTKNITEETEFGAFPNVTSLIGEQRALNLNISILGAYTTKNDNTFSSFEARLFTGNVPKGLANARSLFIPEASSFGTQIKYTTGITIDGKKPNRQITTNAGGIFELNLLSKRLGSINSLSSTTPTSSTSAADDLNNFVIHARLAGELVVVKEVFSIYSSVNWITLIDNVQRFREYYKGLNQIENQSSWFFFDVGGRLMFNPSGGDAKKLVGSDLKIVADFSFIIPKMWGRQLINGTNDVTKTDMILPVIRIGIRKSLGYIHQK